jgi:hypothetical protein
VSGEQARYTALLSLRHRAETLGLALYNVASRDVARCDSIHVALPGRNDRITEFKIFLRNVEKAVIHAMSFTWEPSGARNSEPGISRYAVASRADLEELRGQPPTHGRLYAKHELGDNFTYVMREILSMCEESGVRLALHPNDLPAASRGGCPLLDLPLRGLRARPRDRRKPLPGHGVLHGLLAVMGTSFRRYTGRLRVGTPRACPLAYICGRNGCPVDRHQAQALRPLFLQIGFPGPHLPNDPIASHTGAYLVRERTFPSITADTLAGQPPPFWRCASTTPRWITTPSVTY